KIAAPTKRGAKNVEASIRPGLPASSSFLLVSCNNFSGVKRVEISPIRLIIGRTTRSMKGCCSSISSSETFSPRWVASAKRASTGSPSSPWAWRANLAPTTTSRTAPPMMTSVTIMPISKFILHLDVCYFHHNKVTRENQPQYNTDNDGRTNRPTGSNRQQIFGVEKPKNKGKTKGDQ